MAEFPTQPNDGEARGSENRPVGTSEGPRSQTATSAYEGMGAWVHPLATFHGATGKTHATQQPRIARKVGFNINSKSLLFCSNSNSNSFELRLGSVRA